MTRATSVQSGAVHRVDPASPRGNSAGGGGASTSPRAPQSVPTSSPRGRVLYVDVNAPAIAGAAQKPILVDQDGLVMCTRCGQPIKARVMELNHKPYDQVCYRIEAVADTEIAMPNTANPEKPPARTYVNRKADRELAAVKEEQDKYHKKWDNKGKKKKKKNLLGWPVSSHCFFFSFFRSQESAATSGKNQKRITT